MNRFQNFVFSGVCMFFSLHAETADQAFDVRTTGYFIWDAGYLNEAKNLTGDKLKSVPFSDIIGGLVLSAKPTDRLALIINPELKSYFPFTKQDQQEHLKSMKWEVYMEEARADWAFGDAAKPSITASLGYMIYKENPDARIFGDYLFRSMIYPAVLFTKFNYPQSQVFGFHLWNKLGGSFQHNLFLTSETKYYPYFDFSLAYNASYNYKNLVEVGAGVNLKNVLPVRPSFTTPNNVRGGEKTNVYYEIPFQTYSVSPDSIVTIMAAGLDSTDIIMRNAAGVTWDSMRVEGQGVNGALGGFLVNTTLDDPAHFTDPVSGYLLPQIQRTTTRYSFAGTLVTARIALNPLSVLGVNPLGKDALKIYMEGAVLGIKNYPGFYEKIGERVPIMGGMNLPTFNVLDFLTFEMEYYPNPRIPSRWGRANLQLPLQVPERTVLGWSDPIEAEKLGKKDDWKWGVAAKKSFKGFSLVAQAGTDHLKLLDDASQDYHDVLQRPSHWYAQLRFIGGIY